MKYKYLIGGITIITDIYFPEMVKSSAEADVVISMGNVPENLHDNEVDFPFIEANECQYLLKLPKIGRFLVENGTSVIIQPCNDASIDDVKNYVMTAVFGTLSYQRNMIPMHGGVFLINGKAVLISGFSGSGKSALLAGLYQKGYPILADDISNIRIETGKAMVYPAFPRIMVWKDTLQKLNIATHEICQIRTEMEKYFLPVNKLYFNKPIELSKIVILSCFNEHTGLVLAGLKKTLEIRNNLFHPWMPLVFKKQSFYSQQVLVLSSLVTVELFFNDFTKGIDPMVEKLIAHAQ